jgi:hypothetical protein
MTKREACLGTTKREACLGMTPRSAVPNEVKDAVPKEVRDASLSLGRTKKDARQDNVGDLF